jgi:hypothetical protein
MRNKRGGKRKKKLWTKSHFCGKICGFLPGIWTENAWMGAFQLLIDFDRSNNYLQINKKN